jgi:hypothetical protein
MLGSLTLAANPSGALEAATKQYVDTGLATKQATLGFTPVNKAGDTGVGPMTFSGAATFQSSLTLSADPGAALQAATKNYVDTGVASRIPINGATVSGTYLFNGKLQASATPTAANDVLNKSFFDSFINTTPKIAASAYFNTATAPASVSAEAFYLSVLGSRTAGSSTLTINYGSLSPRYHSLTAPFFLQNQYIGIDLGTAGVTGKLYKIDFVDGNAKTFTITTTETTVLTGVAIRLALVFDSTLTAGAYNVKSIYLDATAIAKYYVNYVNDILTGSPTQIFTLPETNYQVNGNAIVYNGYSGFALACRDAGRTTYIHSSEQSEGFGATTMGAHIGFYYSGTDGINNTAVFAASFIITCF